MSKAFFFFALIFELGCQPGPSQDPLEQGFEAMDRGQYDQAIQIFEKQHQSQPEDSRPAMALSSAYAARAGLKVEKFWDFYQQLKGPALTPVYLQNHSFYQSYLQHIDPFAFLLPVETKADLDRLFLTLTALHVFRDRAKTYPYVDLVKRQDVRNAVIVLEPVKEPGARLYKAILTGALVRSELDDGFDFLASIGNPFADLLAYPLEFRRILCTPVTGGLTSWAHLQLERIQDIALDLQSAYPSEAKKLENFTLPLAALDQEMAALDARLLPSGCQP